MAESDELPAIRAFDRRLLARAATRSVEHRFGTAFFHDALPLMWDLHRAFVERSFDEATPESVIAEVEPLQAGAALDYRRVVVRDEETGDRLAPGFEAAGWEVKRFIYMAHRHAPDRAARPGLAREATVATARAIEAATLREDPVLREPATARALLAGRDALASGARTRFFVGALNGVDASVCTLYSDGAVAQIEDVNTLLRFRGHGLARAVVTAAIAAAWEAGHEILFLVADARDWPQQLYAKLGFVPVGTDVVLTRLPPGWAP
jgi:GNAT superfamily N-acetyltransferase